MNCIHHGLSLHLAYLQLKLNLCRFDLIQTGFHQPYVKKTTTDILSESTTKNLKKLSTIDTQFILGTLRNWVTMKIDIRHHFRSLYRFTPDTVTLSTIDIHTRHCHTFY